MNDKEKYFLKPGCIFVSRDPYLIHTVLGSCVSVCIWDSVLKIGGMNHYIYSRPIPGGKSAQYGSISIPYLLKLMEDLGCVKKDLKAHIIGGAQNPELRSFQVGDENVRIADAVLERNGIDVVARDIGGSMGKKVVFDNQTGEVLVYKVSKIRVGDWYEENKGSNY